jgi:hypothetical protein
MRCSIAITACLSCQLMASLQAQDDSDKGIKELHGNWRAVEMQTAGNRAPKEVLEKARLEIKDGEMTWQSGGHERSEVQDQTRPEQVAEGDRYYLPGRAGQGLDLPRHLRAGERAVAALLLAHQGPPQRLQDRARPVTGVSHPGTRETEMTPFAWSHGRG